MNNSRRIDMVQMWVLVLILNTPAVPYWLQACAILMSCSLVAQAILWLFVKYCYGIDLDKPKTEQP